MERPPLLGQIISLSIFIICALGTNSRPLPFRKVLIGGKSRCPLLQNHTYRRNTHRWEADRVGGGDFIVCRNRMLMYRDHVASG